jgi:hypothetical protein
MHRLPDGSGFFIGTVGPREPGPLNWLKYHRKGYARGWLMLWRNYRTARDLSREPGHGPPLSVWRSARWSWDVRPRGVWP